MKPVIVRLVCSLILLFGLEAEGLVCTPNPDIPGPPLPILPESFVADVVFTDMISNWTSERQEFYDYNQNRAAIVKWSIENPERLVYTGTNQVFRITKNLTDPTAPPSCQTVNVTNSRSAGIPMETVDGHAHLAKPSLFFSFGTDFNVTYNGTATIRGMPVNHWYHCKHNRTSGEVHRYDWYFTVPGYPVKGGPGPPLDQVPVRTDITGWGGSRGELHYIHDYHHVYVANPVASGPPGQLGELTDLFMIHSDCPGRVNVKELPKIPEQFVMRLEFRNQTATAVMVHNIKEVYDHIRKLHRTERVTSTLQPGVNSALGHYYFVHDYNTGLQYRVHKEQSDCTVVPIPSSDDPLMFWAATDTDGHVVHMKSPLEMFHFDDKKFTFEGKEGMRGMPTDIWVSREKNYHAPAGSSQGVDALFEWHFTEGEDRTPYGTNVTQKQVPIALTIRQDHVPMGMSPVTLYMYNIFHFEDNPFEIMNYFDISKCYLQDHMHQRLVFQTELPHLDDPSRLDRMNAAITNKFRQVVSAATGITEVRIPTVTHGPNKDKHVWLNILERPSVMGDVTAPEQPSLKDVLVTLNQTVKENKLKITLNVSNKEVELRALPGSLLTEEEYNRRNSKPEPSTGGVQPGVVGGIAVGSAILGVLLAVAADRLRNKVPSLQNASSRSPLLVQEDS